MVVVKGVGPRPLAYWDYRFESRREQESLALVNFACYQVEVSVSVLSLVQRSLTQCGVSECDRETSIRVVHGPSTGRRAIKKKLVGEFLS